MPAERTLENVRNADVIANRYMSLEAIRDLAKFLERYPQVSKVEREDYFLFALRRIEALKASLILISAEAFMESVHLSVNILEFRQCLDETFSELAKGNLRRINELLQRGS